jgi:hypothetical protein
MDPTEKSNDVAGSCPGCGHPENPPENRFCGRCGVPLQHAPARRSSKELALRARERGITLKERFLPTRLGPVAKTVAASLAILAAEAGVAWLRYRMEKLDGPALPHSMGQQRREKSPEVGSEYLHGYILKEAVLLHREGQKARRFYSSELTITSSRVEK